MKKRTCETEGCENPVRPQMQHCDGCIVDLARERRRERDTTERGVRGGQGRSGHEVEQSTLGAAVGIGGITLIVLSLLVAGAVRSCMGPGDREAATHSAASYADEGGEGAGHEVP